MDDVVYMTAPWLMRSSFSWFCVHNIVQTVFFFAYIVVFVELLCNDMKLLGLLSDVAHLLIHVLCQQLLHARLLQGHQFRQPTA